MIDEQDLIDECGELEKVREKEDMQFEGFVDNLVKEAMYDVDDLPSKRLANVAHYFVSVLEKAYGTLEMELKRDIIEGLQQAYVIGQEELGQQ